MYIDSHAHLEGPRFAADRDAVIERARAAGVTTILSVGQVSGSWEGLGATLALAEQHPFVYASVGLHPHDAKHFDSETGERMLALARHPKVVAWGECGLDFYYDNSPRDAQRTAFREQLRLAREANLPVIIHSRDAAEETLDMLAREWAGGARGGVFHCFSYDAGVARAAVDLGMYVSFSGIVTFQNAAGVREAAVQAPLDRILIETDCPFLAPTPHRGKRNEPAFVVEVAAEIARLRACPPLEIAEATSVNFHRLFLDTS